MLYEESQVPLRNVLRFTNKKIRKNSQETKLQDAKNGSYMAIKFCSTMGLNLINTHAHIHSEMSFNSHF